MGVDGRAAVAHETDEGDSGALRELDGETRDARDGRDERYARAVGFLDDLEADAPAHLEGVRGERQAASPKRVADHLVDRVVSADVLAEREELAGRAEESGRVERAREMKELLPFAQKGGKTRGDGWR